MATPKSTLVEDNQFGTHFRIVYDLNDADLALLLGDFKVQGIPYVGTDGVWDINDTSIIALGATRLTSVELFLIQVIWRLKHHIFLLIPHILKFKTL